MVTGAGVPTFKMRGTPWRSLDQAVRISGAGDRRLAVNPASPQHCRLSFRGSMMIAMSFSETIFLFVLALVIFGPKKLPEIARQAGKLLNEFRRASNEFKSQIEQEIAHIEVEKNRPMPVAPPIGATSRTPSPSATLAAVPGPESTTPAALQAAVPAPEDEPLFASGSRSSAEPDSAAPTAEAAPGPVETSAQESHA